MFASASAIKAASDPLLAHTSTAFQGRTHTLIVTKQWDQLVRYKNPRICPKKVADRNRQLANELTRRWDITQELFDAIERIDGPVSSWKWCDRFDEDNPSPEFVLFAGNRFGAGMDSSFLPFVLWETYLRDVRMEVLTRLVEDGADVNDASYDASYGRGATHLHMCVGHMMAYRWANHDDVFLYLLANGADPLLPNRVGRTPLDNIRQSSMSEEKQRWILAEMEKWA
jgi:hypothetical protein